MHTEACNIPRRPVPSLAAVQTVTAGGGSAPSADLLPSSAPTGVASTVKRLASSPAARGRQDPCRAAPNSDRAAAGLTGGGNAPPSASEGSGLLQDNVAQRCDSPGAILLKAGSFSSPMQAMPPSGDNAVTEAELAPGDRANRSRSCSAIAEGVSSGVLQLVFLVS